MPTIGPNVAVEILSRGQTLENSQRRIEILCACGTSLVILIDPFAEQAWLVDATGTRRLTRDDAIEHSALPSFSLPLKRCFDRVPPGGVQRS